MRKLLIARFLIILMLCIAVPFFSCSAESIKKQFSPIGLISAYTFEEYDTSGYGRALLTYLVGISINLDQSIPFGIDMSNKENVYKIGFTDTDAAIISFYTPENYAIVYYFPNSNSSYTLFYTEPDIDNNSGIINALVKEIHTIADKDLALAQDAFIRYIEYMSSSE